MWDWQAFSGSFRGIEGLSKTKFFLMKPKGYFIEVYWKKAKNFRNCPKVVRSTNGSRLNYAKDSIGLFSSIGIHILFLMFLGTP